MVSAWELAIKAGIGKLKLTQNAAELLEEEALKNGFAVLPVELKHIAPVKTMPLHHRDPFDRLLIAQSLVEGMPIISADSAFDLYEGLVRIW